MNFCKSKSIFLVPQVCNYKLFSLIDWFPGWSQHGHYNRQPNDDGLSDQDCVELRQAYHLPSSLSRLAASFHWNDRDCSTPNYFICERLLSDGEFNVTYISYSISAFEF